MLLFAIKLTCVEALSCGNFTDIKFLMKYIRRLIRFIVSLFMQNKPTIKLRLARLSNTALQSFAETLVTNMTGSAFYTTPNPPLATIQADITAFAAKVTEWGSVGNRGSHQSHVELLAALANYCETTTPYNETAFVSCGWEIKNPKSVTGPLPAVQNLRQFLSRTISYGQVKLRWKRPLNTAFGVVNAYNVYRNTVSNFSTATLVATVTQASIIQSGLTLNTYYYWVVLVGAAGAGVTSDVCLASVAILP